MEKEICGKAIKGLESQTKKLDFILKATQAVHLGSPVHFQ